MSDLLLVDFAKLLLHFEFFDRSLKAYGPRGLFLGFTFIRGRQPAALKQNVHFLLWTWTLVYLGHRSSSLTLICAVSLILPLRDLWVQSLSDAEVLKQFTTCLEVVKTFLESKCLTSCKLCFLGILILRLTFWTDTSNDEGCRPLH